MGRAHVGFASCNKLQQNRTQTSLSFVTRCPGSKTFGTQNMAGAIYMRCTAGTIQLHYGDGDRESDDIIMNSTTLLTQRSMPNVLPCRVSPTFKGNQERKLERQPVSGRVLTQAANRHRTPKLVDQLESIKANSSVLRNVAAFNHYLLRTRILGTKSR